MLGKLPAGKVLYLGNSITLHVPAPSIGWMGNWGMAASEEAKDYVHLLTAAVAGKTGVKPEILVRNIADFERGHETFDIETTLKEPLEFHADLIILAIGENVADLNTEEARVRYATAFSNLLSSLKKQGRPTIFVRSCFWPNQAKDEIMKRAATEADAIFVDIAELGAEETNAARSERQFENAGVAGHPGDKGMRAIAEALFAAIQKQGQSIASQ